MNKCFTVLLLLLSFFAKAQTEEKFFDYNWKPCAAEESRFYALIIKTDSGYLRKDYFIHEKLLQMQGLYEDSACNISNGSFYFFHSNGILQSFGNYVHGKKNGLWLSYHFNGVISDSILYNDGNIIGTNCRWHSNGFLSDSIVVNKDGSMVAVSWFSNGAPSSAGRYNSAGNQNGKWVYYHNNGEKSSLETYDNGTLLVKKYYDEAGLLVDTLNRQDRQAIFLGKAKTWENYLSKSLYFPDQYTIINRDKAIVIVNFTINEKGEIDDVFISSRFYKAFDKIAENVIKKSPKWAPEISHNRSVARFVRQRVIFKQKIE